MFSNNYPIGVTQVLNINQIFTLSSKKCCDLWLIFDNKKSKKIFYKKLSITAVKKWDTEIWRLNQVASSCVSYCNSSEKEESKEPRNVSLLYIFYKHNFFQRYVILCNEAFRKKKYRGQNDAIAISPKFVHLLECIRVEFICTLLVM